MAQAETVLPLQHTQMCRLAKLPAKWPRDQRNGALRTCVNKRHHHNTCKCLKSRDHALGVRSDPQKESWQWWQAGGLVRGEGMSPRVSLQQRDARTVPCRTPCPNAGKYLGGDVCLASWHVKAGGWRGTLAAFFSILEKKTENSSEALAAGLTDTKQPRNKAQRRDFKATQAPLSVCSRTLLLPPGKGTATLLKEVTSIIPHFQLLKAR